MSAPTLVAVVIPCFRVREQVLGVIARIGPEVGLIVVVDDGCPEGSADHVEANCRDPRVVVVRHAQNQGVGGAVCSGYTTAMERNAGIVVKVDGDGQMDPALIPLLIAPILRGESDYVKGNRFHNLSDVRGMPRVRLIGNAGLSFLNKLSTGYWQVFDPTNGFTAIHANLLAQLPLEYLARRYFFESDLLYQLGQLRARVSDMPMRAVYAEEPSSLRPSRVFGPFLRGHLRNIMRRLFYTYFVRGFSLASVELALGNIAVLFGVCFGLWHWIASATTNVPASAGTVMLAALPVVIGTQLLLSWLNYDVHQEPTQTISAMLPPPNTPPR